MNQRIFKQLNISVLGALLLLSQAAVAEPSQRTEPSDVEHATIDAAGLDLSSRAGARRLYRRIVATAQNVCGSESRHFKGVHRAKHEHEHVRPCIRRVVDEALAQVADASGLDLEQVAGLDRLEERSFAASR